MPGSVRRAGSEPVSINFSSCPQRYPRVTFSIDALLQPLMLMPSNAILCFHWYHIARQQLQQLPVPLLLAQP